ncbi:hypothetical protein EV651_1129 [Kribbella sp. VKM Ac-2571]|nr:hypothetical protein EV651_1129 [Kribbella sp. VKM Ac-2571]
MNSTGYTASSGRFCHSTIPSTTLSVIVEIVCRDTCAPYTSARCAEISPVVSPLADNKITISSTPDNRFCRFATIRGSKLASRSRGTSISTSPTSVSTVLDRTPLREFPVPRPAGSCLS